MKVAKIGRMKEMQGMREAPITSGLPLLLKNHLKREEVKSCCAEGGGEGGDKVGGERIWRRERGKFVLAEEERRARKRCCG